MLNPAQQPMVHLGASVIYTDDRGVDHAAIVTRVFDKATGSVSLFVMPADGGEIVQHGHAWLVSPCLHADPLQPEPGTFVCIRGHWSFRISEAAKTA